MTTVEVLAIVSSVVATINTLALLYFTARKNKPEVKKLEVEGDSEIVDAAHTNLEGAEISQKMLVARIDELKKDLDSEKKARQEDRIYFTRRIKEIDREARDYRLWAARLAKQVIEAGKVPVPFISSLNDSDPLLTVINKEQGDLEREKNKREQELNDHKEKE